jgi:hypothetical protein
VLNSSIIINRQEKVLIWLHFALIMVIYASVGYFSPGFDDEYFNLMVVEHFGSGIASYTQTTDVHPPLSYLLNNWLFKSFGKWEYVRMISGILTATSIIAAISSLGRNRNVSFSLILIYLLAFNPAILMWGTSLRWYGYFIPLLIWLIIVPENMKWHWPKFFLLMLLMGYLAYISFFILPSMFLYYWIKDKRDALIKIKAILIPGILSLLIYIPQLIIFFNVHYPRSGGQVFSLPSGLIGVLSTYFSNQGVFPLSVPGIASALGSGIVLLYLTREVKKELKGPYLLSLFTGLIILLATRIAGKMRNLIVLIPMQVLWIAEKISKPISRWIVFAAGLIIFGNLVGSYNVITHEDTTKNSWNIPVREVTDLINKELEKEKSSILLYCHDPIITWHLEKRGYQVRSPYAHQKIITQDKKISNVVVIWTNPGYLPKRVIDLYHFEIDLMKSSSQTDYIMGKDKYASIKRKKEPQYPDELVKISVIKDPDQIAASSAWSPVFIQRFK